MSAADGLLILVRSGAVLALVGLSMDDVPGHSALSRHPLGRSNMTLVIPSVEAMRYAPQHKEETHRRIVETASRVFRREGFEGVGIAKLMGMLGLTHGGFYAHFQNKETLVDAATAAGLDESEALLLGALRSGGFPAMLDLYLGEVHRDDPAAGCLLPALAAEVARRSLPSRDEFSQRLARLLDALAEHMPGRSPELRRQNVKVVIASLVGAVSLARATSDPMLSGEILRSTREHLLGLSMPSDG